MENKGIKKIIFEILSFIGRHIKSKPVEDKTKSIVWKKKN